jgi:hypothetical protein
MGSAILVSASLLLNFGTTFSPVLIFNNRLVTTPHHQFDSSIPLLMGEAWRPRDQTDFLYYK